MIELEQRDDRVAVVTLNRPEKRNAVDTQACIDLAAAVDDAVGSGARALVLRGAGTNFCSGADLTGVESDGFVATLYRTLDALRDVPICTIAAVHGAALGAGTQLAIACDLRVVAPDARFGIPAAKLGLMTDHWTAQRLSLLAGPGPARAVLLACEELDADASVRLGLANRAGDLEAAVGWASDIAALAPLTIAGHKLALNRLEPKPHDPEVEEAFRRAWASEDLVEGQRARAERRKPDFRGR
ncbi:MAG TPA: enoyl-CoA hydratase [Acidimicrobiales bacterium]|nr:enoyl-CoA hydratase [Acidimicrobiales bacterium]